MYDNERGGFCFDSIDSINSCSQNYHPLVLDIYKVYK